tara:strand:- start:25 stop:513 length:489 start_codon:yes stop_codon:yes gene_type:complete
MAITKIIADSITSGAIANTPYFQATMSAHQSPANNALTKVNFDTASIDSDSDYDTTNKRFVPQTAGKFLIHAEIFLSGNAADNLYSGKISLYKNGSRINSSDWFFNTNFIDSASLHVQAIVDMNGSTDYLEIYGLVRTNTGSGINIYRDDNRCVYQGYKLIT